jgi:hypothetical protein
MPQTWLPLKPPRPSLTACAGHRVRALTHLPPTHTSPFQEETPHMNRPARLRRLTVLAIGVTTAITLAACGQPQQ